jgi:hypothetical protein
MKRPAVCAPPIRKEDSSWARDDEQKAELFADYLEQNYLKTTWNKYSSLMSNKVKTKTS